MQRCLTAGQLAADIAKLRLAKQRLGFLPIPVGSYLQRLAKNADVRLVPVLEWCRIDLSSVRDIAFSRGWARLAKEIGLGLREAIVHIQLSFTEVTTPNLMPVLVRRRNTGPARQTRVDEFEKLVGKIVLQWDEETVARLGAAEAEIRNAYTQG